MRSNDWLHSLRALPSHIGSAGALASRLAVVGATCIFVIGTASARPVAAQPADCDDVTTNTVVITDYVSLLATPVPGSSTGDPTKPDYHDVIDEAMKHGTDICIPSGQYYTSTLTVPKNVTSIRGGGELV